MTPAGSISKKEEEEARYHFDTDINYHISPQYAWFYLVLIKIPGRWKCHTSLSHFAWHLTAITRRENRASKNFQLDHLRKHKQQKLNFHTWKTSIQISETHHYNSHPLQFFVRRNVLVPPITLFKALMRSQKNQKTFRCPIRSSTSHCIADTSRVKYTHFPLTRSKHHYIFQRYLLATISSRRPRHLSNAKEPFFIFPL